MATLTRRLFLLFLLLFCHNSVFGQKIKVGNAEYEVEVISSKEREERGLAGYPHLKPNTGMLFIYRGEPNPPAFWMKGMQFPIDIIWIKNHRILQIHHHVPPPLPGQKDSDLLLYMPTKPIDAVLEINAGEAKRNHIREGDQVVPL